MDADLVFVGVVVAIENAPVGIRGGFLDWIIRTRVERVTTGTFEGEHFAFRIHSPSRAGLAVGTRFTLKARRVPDGFEILEPR
jgi:hypothetical protein